MLYKLDGGIDHILVDEAQDTAPEQWDILRALTDEFFAGAGRRARGRPPARTLFVVGDEKQSIYSFQGARPERLPSETERYLDRASPAPARAASAVPADASFRSTPQVLAFVDAVFDDPATLAGASSRAERRARSATPPTAPGHGGCVDLWPLEREAKGEEREAWDAPLDAEPRPAPTAAWPRRIAAEIEALVARGDAVFDKDDRRLAAGRLWRRADPGAPPRRAVRGDPARPEARRACRWPAPTGWRCRSTSPSTTCWPWPASPCSPTTS